MATNISYFPALQIFPWLYRKQESSLLLQSKTRFKHISLRLMKLILNQKKLCTLRWRQCWILLPKENSSCSALTCPGVRSQTNLSLDACCFLSRANVYLGVCRDDPRAQSSPRDCQRVAAPRVGPSLTGEVFLRLSSTSCTSTDWVRIRLCRRTIALQPNEPRRPLWSSHQRSALMPPPCPLQSTRWYLIWHDACQGRSKLGKLLNPSEMIKWACAAAVLYVMGLRHFWPCTGSPCRYSFNVKQHIFRCCCLYLHLQSCSSY